MLVSTSAVLYVRVQVLETERVWWERVVCSVEWIVHLCDHMRGCVLW